MLKKWSFKKIKTKGLIAESDVFSTTQTKFKDRIGDQSTRKVNKISLQKYI